MDITKYDLQLKNFEIENNNNGFFSINSSLGKKITNYTGQYIISLIKNQYEIDNMIEMISKRFSIDKIKSKKSLFHILRELDYIGIVKVYYSDTCLEDDIVNVVGEREYLAMSNSISLGLKNNNYTLYSITSDEKYYNIILLRTRCIHNNENYFFDYFDEEKQCYNNMIGIQYISRGKTVPTVSVIQSNSYNQVFYDSLWRYLKELGVGKLRMVELEGVVKGAQYEEFKRNEGFFYEAKLSREDGIHDYIYYSKFL